MQKTEFIALRKQYTTEQLGEIKKSDIVSGF